VEFGRQQDDDKPVWGGRGGVGWRATFPVGLCGVLMRMSFVWAVNASSRAAWGMLQSCSLSFTGTTTAPARAAMGAYASYMGSKIITCENEPTDQHTQGAGGGGGGIKVI